MPDIYSIGTALLITLGLVSVSILIVAAAMWWVYRFFKNQDETDLDSHDSNER